MILLFNLMFFELRNLWRDPFRLFNQTICDFYLFLLLNHTISNIDTFQLLSYSNSDLFIFAFANIIL